jgi:hypothetical protein
VVLDAEAVLRSVESVLAAVAERPRAKAIRYKRIALSSQGEVVLPVDRRGQALSLAPVSMDARGEPAARAIASESVPSGCSRSPVSLSTACSPSTRLRQGMLHGVRPPPRPTAL